MTALLEELEKKFRELQVCERVRFVEDLWDSIAEAGQAMPVPDWQKEELARRKQEHLKHPESVKTWDQVKQNILNPS
jgi:putative addiction module component (TIGR02574 family)